MYLFIENILTYKSIFAILMLLKIDIIHLLLLGVNANIWYMTSYTRHEMNDVLLKIWIKNK
jgi:hypothetical protein